MLEDEEIFNKVIEPLFIRNIGPLIIETLKNNGYRLIRLREYKGSSNTLQFMIEHNNMKNVEISDCVKISKLLTNLLDKNPIGSNFNIEVSSPGVERPLIVACICAPTASMIAASLFAPPASAAV